MGWLSRFRKKKIEEDTAEESVFDEENPMLAELERQQIKVEKEHVDIRDSQARVAYIERLYGAIQDTKKQCDDIKFEYGRVTSYLKDIQLIDQAPESEKEALVTAARRILDLTRERKKLQKKEYKFTDAQRRALENYEDIAHRHTKKLKEYEEFQIKIKNDLRQLEGEKKLLLADKKDIIQRQSLLKVVGKCLTALLVAVACMLFVLMYCFKVNIEIPFVITVGLAFALAAIVLVEARKNRIDMVITEKKCNRAVFLSNRVKIKYVNNVRTLDYMYHKYHVRNATELEFVHGQYLQAKREWARQRESSIQINENNKIVLAELGRLDIKDCEIWLGQIEALVEPKEMVEVRHALNVQRQKLREQLDYNMGVMQECLEEIDAIRCNNPEYAEEVEQILSSMDWRK